MQAACIQEARDKAADITEAVRELAVPQAEAVAVVEVAVAGPPAEDTQVAEAERPVEEAVDTPEAAGVGAEPLAEEVVVVPLAVVEAVVVAAGIIKIRCS